MTFLSDIKGDERSRAVAALGSTWRAVSFGRRAAVLLAFFAIAASLAGCARTALDVVDSHPMACMNDPVQVEVLVLRHFDETLKARYGLFGLVTWSEPDLSSFLEKQAREAGGDGTINVKVSGSFSFFDTLIGLPLFPLYLQRSYRIEGDVVKVGR